jgi:hypothetical protein
MHNHLLTYLRIRPKKKYGSEFNFLSDFLSEIRGKNTWRYKANHMSHFY